MSLVSHDEIKRAAKPHRCDWCQERIEVGSPYVRQFVKDGADVWTWRAHPECYEASGELDQQELDESAFVGAVFVRGCSHDRHEHCARCGGAS